MKYIVFLLSLFLSAAIIGCCSCTRSSDAGKQSIIQPFKITYESGGGFSGHHSGYIFSSDGTISRISWFPLKEKKIEVIDSTHKAHIFEIKQLIDQSNISNLSIMESGNMTTALSVDDGNRSYSFSWNGMSTEKESVPKVLLPVIEKILDLINIVQQDGAQSK